MDIHGINGWRKDGEEAYCSIHRFPESLKQHVETTDSVSGYQGTSIVDYVVFDFDCEADPNQALDDARKFVKHLEENFDVSPDDLKYSFSGNKGFHLLIPARQFEIDSPRDDMDKLVKAIVNIISIPSDTLDTSIHDRMRLLRLRNSIHKKSGLYKIELSPREFLHRRMDKIKNLAKQPRSGRQDTKGGEMQANERLVEVRKQAESAIAGSTVRSTRETSAKGCKVIPDGQRNFTLFQESCRLRDAGHAEDSALAAVISLNEVRCQPPLDEEEVRGIVKNAFGYENSDLLAKLATTDYGNAESIALTRGHELRYDHTLSKWYNWNGHVWIPDKTRQITGIAADVARERQVAARDIADKDSRERHICWASHSESEARIGAALRLATSMSPIAATRDIFDTDLMLLGCSNGVVDLRTGKLKPGLPADMISMSTDIAYDPAAQAPRWIQFLDEVFCGNKELIDYIWRLSGYCLTGSISEQLFALLVGSGENGKSVFIMTLQHVWGEYAANTPFSTFLQSKYDNSKVTNNMAALAGSRLVTASEVKENVVLNEGTIKSVTGGDAITARFLYKENFTFVPQLKLFFAVNHKPTVLDTTHSLWRRIKVLPFHRQFSDKDRDNDLLDKLKQEAPGILAWAVKGCLEWQKRPLKDPESVREATREYRTEMDIFEQFLDDRTVKRPGAEAESQALYNAYTSWCTGNGERPATGTWFGTKMKELRFEKKRRTDKGKRQTIYRGVGLLSNTTDEH